MSLEQTVVDEARSWILTPYHSQQRVKGVGVDCAQLLIGVYVNARAIEPTNGPEYYSPDWHFHHNEEVLLEWVERYAREVTEARPADIVMYRFGKTFSHVGIVTEWPFVVHAVRKDRIVHEEDGRAGVYAPPREIKLYRLRQL